MPEGKEKAPEKEEKKPETPTEEKEGTVGEALKEAIPSKGKKEEPKPETVGLDKFLDVKNDNKELKRQIKVLEDKIESGDFSKGEIAEDIDAIASEYDVDPKFLKKFAATVKSQAKKEAEAEVSSKLKPIEDKERAEKIDIAFNKHFNKAMNDMPEFKDVVNPDVIKTLSLDPRNADKTFKQLIEETYGKSLTGKRTVEPTKPGGGKEPEEIDYARAKKDGEYFKEIMANPELKKKYNSDIHKRIVF